MTSSASPGILAPELLAGAIKNDSSALLQTHVKTLESYTTQLPVNFGSFRHTIRKLSEYHRHRLELSLECRSVLIQHLYVLVTNPDAEWPLELSSKILTLFAELLTSKPKELYMYEQLPDLVLDWKPLYALMERYVLVSDGEITFVRNRHEQTHFVRSLTIAIERARVFFPPESYNEIYTAFFPSAPQVLATSSAFEKQSLFSLFMPSESPKCDIKAYIEPVHELLTTHFDQHKEWACTWIQWLSRASAVHMQLFSSSTKYHDYVTQWVQLFLHTLQLQVHSKRPVATWHQHTPKRQQLFLYHGQGSSMGHAIGALLVNTMDTTIDTTEWLLSQLETFFHPSSGRGAWSGELAALLRSCTRQFAENIRLLRINADDSISRRFSNMWLHRILAKALFSKNYKLVDAAHTAYREYALVYRRTVLNSLLDMAHHSLTDGAANQPHRTLSCLGALVKLTTSVIGQDNDIQHDTDRKDDAGELDESSDDIADRINGLMWAILQALDPTDLQKTFRVLSFSARVCGQAQHLQKQMDLEDWSFELFDGLLTKVLLHTDAGRAAQNVARFLRNAFVAIFGALPKEVWNARMKQALSFVTTEVADNSLLYATLLSSAAVHHPKEAMHLAFDALSTPLLEQLESMSMDVRQSDSSTKRMLWYLEMLDGIVSQGCQHVLESECWSVIERIYDLGTASNEPSLRTASNQLIRGAIETAVSFGADDWKPREWDNTINWRVPDAKQLHQDLKPHVHRLLDSAFDKATTHLSAGDYLEARKDLERVTAIAQAAVNVLGDWDEPESQSELSLRNVLPSFQLRSSIAERVIDCFELCKDRSVLKQVPCIEQLCQLSHVVLHCIWYRDAPSMNFEMQTNVMSQHAISDMTSKKKCYFHFLRVWEHDIRLQQCVAMLIGESRGNAWDKVPVVRRLVEHLLATSVGIFDSERKAAQRVVQQSWQVYPLNITDCLLYYLNRVRTTVPDNQHLDDQGPLLAAIAQLQSMVRRGWIHRTPQRLREFTKTILQHAEHHSNDAVQLKLATLFQVFIGESWTQVPRHETVSLDLIQCALDPQSHWRYELMSISQLFVLAPAWARDEKDANVHDSSSSVISQWSEKLHYGVNSNVLSTQLACSFAWLHLWHVCGAEHPIVRQAAAQFKLDDVLRMFLHDHPVLAAGTGGGGGSGLFGANRGAGQKIIDHLRRSCAARMTQSRFSTPKGLALDRLHVIFLRAWLQVCPTIRESLHTNMVRMFDEDAYAETKLSQHDISCTCAELFVALNDDESGQVLALLPLAIQGLQAHRLVDWQEAVRLIVHDSCRTGTLATVLRTLVQQAFGATAEHTAVTRQNLVLLFANAVFEGIGMGDTRKIAEQVLADHLHEADAESLGHFVLRQSYGVAFSAIVCALDGDAKMISIPDEKDGSIVLEDHTSMLVQFASMMLGIGESRHIVGWLDRLLPLFVRASIGTSDNAKRASQLVHRLSFIRCNPQYVHEILKVCTTMLKQSDSDCHWHVQRAALEFLSVFVPRHAMLLGEAKFSYKSFVKFLKHSQSEVRTATHQLLSSWLQCLSPAQSESVRELLYKKMLQWSRKKNSVEQQHGGVLGLASFVSICPYSVPEWLPDILVSLAEIGQRSEASLVSTAVSDTLADFRRTHQDEWEMTFKAKFTPEQLEVMQMGRANLGYFA
jgi:Domain of unknown function (DUF3437)/Proteasome-substrate-size regulator, mid region